MTRFTVVVLSVIVISLMFAGLSYGKIDPKTGEFFTKGIIDDVGLFNIALTETDIKHIMTDGLTKTLGLTAVSPLGKLASTWGDIKQ